MCVRPPAVLAGIPATTDSVSHAVFDSQLLEASLRVAFGFHLLEASLRSAFGSWLLEVSRVIGQSIEGCVSSVLVLGR